MPIDATDLRRLHEAARGKVSGVAFLAEAQYLRNHVTDILAALEDRERLTEEMALLCDAAQAVITTLDRANQYETIRARLKSAAIDAARGAK